MTFPHESLPVYRLAVDIQTRLDALCERLPRYRYYLTDQIRRAALSIVLNLAEGTAEASPAEKVRFYRMARRSVAEVAAALDVVAALEPARARDTGSLKAELARIFDGLSRLIRSQRARAP